MPNLRIIMVPYGRSFKLWTPQRVFVQPTSVTAPRSVAEVIRDVSELSMRTARTKFQVPAGVG